MQPERFAAGLTPLPTAARVTQKRGALRWRLISTLVSLAILGVMVFTIAIVAFWVASSAFWIVVSVVGLQRAKRDLGRIQDGVAFYFDPYGVEFVNPPAPAVPWDRVSALRLTGGLSGAGPSIVLEADGAEVAKVPASFVDAAPAVIDSAARAYSLGRVALGVTALDKVL